MYTHIKVSFYHSYSLVYLFVRAIVCSACTILPWLSGHKCIGKKNICRRIQDSCELVRIPFQRETSLEIYNDNTFHLYMAKPLCRNRTACI